MSPGESMVPSALKNKCFKDKLGTLHIVTIWLFVLYFWIILIGADEILSDDFSHHNMKKGKKEKDKQTNYNNKTPLIILE